jgi:hypothetical protein
MVQCILVYPRLILTGCAVIAGLCVLLIAAALALGGQINSVQLVSTTVIPVPGPAPSIIALYVLDAKRGLPATIPLEVPNMEIAVVRQDYYVERRNTLWIVSRRRQEPGPHDHAIYNFNLDTMHLNLLYAYTSSSFEPMNIARLRDDYWVLSSPHERQIILANLSAGTEQRISEIEIHGAEVWFSPDRTQIVLTGQNTIHVMNMDGSNHRVFTVEPVSPMVNWIADEWLAVSGTTDSDESEVRFIHAETGEPHPTWQPILGQAAILSAKLDCPEPIVGFIESPDEVFTMRGRVAFLDTSYVIQTEDDPRLTEFEFVSIVLLDCNTALILATRSLGGSGTPLSLTSYYVTDLTDGEFGVFHSLLEDTVVVDWEGYVPGELSGAFIYLESDAAGETIYLYRLRTETGSVAERIGAFPASSPEYNPQHMQWSRDYRYAIYNPLPRQYILIDTHSGETHLLPVEPSVGHFWIYTP